MSEENVGKCQCEVCTNGGNCIESSPDWKFKLWERRHEFSSGPDNFDELSDFIQQTISEEHERIIRDAKKMQQDMNIYWNEMPAITLYRLEDVID
jgi:hypothetical protein